MTLNRKEKSIAEAVAMYAKEQPNKLCLGDGKRELSYEAYWRSITGYAKRLKELGVGHGDCVVVRNSQNMEFVIVGLAIQLLGGIFVPVEKNIANNRIMEIYNMVQAKGYIANKAEEVPGFYESMKQVFDYQDEAMDVDTFAFPQWEDTAEILFTTGTTGVSKGIELTHKNVVSVAENVIGGVEMKKDNVELIPVPLSHSHGLRRYYSNMLNGSAVILMDGVVFTAKVFTNMEKYGVKSMDLVPAALATIFQLSGEKIGDYSEQMDYIQLGSAPIPEKDKDTLRKLFPNTRLYNFYGTTESGCSSILDFNKVRDDKNCIGRPTCHAKFAFVDNDGNHIEATKENPGLLACSGDMNMKGYYKSEKLNAETIKDGYIVTQDLSYMDENGMIYLLGRQGDVISSGGNKIAPSEIEDVTLEISGVLECACVPVSHPILGQEPKLFVVMEKDVSYDEEKVHQHLKDRLENYKVPKLIVELDKLPRTYNGKIQRNVLMEM